MRTFIMLVILLIITKITIGQNASTSINVIDNWKFIAADNTNFSNNDFDDSSWKVLSIGKWLSDDGYNASKSIGWYRLKVVIPSALKKENSVIKGLKLALGLISEEDITYFNGVKIAESKGWDAKRNYILPYNQINWDKENTIAVRVKVNETGGGMFDGPYALEAFRLGDVIEFDSDDYPNPLSAQKSDKFNKKIEFTLLKEVDKIPLNLTVKVYNPSKSKLIKTYNFSLNAGTSLDKTFLFAYTAPTASNSKVEYLLTSNILTDTLKMEVVPFYRDPIHNNVRKVEPKIPLSTGKITDKFSLDEIQLEGYLGQRIDDNMVQRLLKIDEKGILECYYNKPGKQSWVGEYVGKYIHAASLAYAYSHSEQLKKQLDRIVDVILSCQNADGYLGNYLQCDYWSAWGVWCHNYNLCGLLSYYQTTSYEPALEASKKIGDLLCRTFGNKKGQLDIVKSGPHQGMASLSVLDPMTHLYCITGDKKYLDFCNYMVGQIETTSGPKLISSLTTVGQVNKTSTGKAYEMIQSIVGISRLYQLTKNPLLLKTAQNAWSDIVSKRLYITGSTSQGEYFADDFDLKAEETSHICEGCVTTTWTHLSQSLFYITGEAKYMDEVEKTIYNHLLAAENPQTGCVSYFTGFQGKKPYRCDIHANCCLASVPRAIAAIPELVFTKNTSNGFRVNIYNEGQLHSNIRTTNGKEIAINCQIIADKQNDGKYELTLNTEKPGNFELYLRVPAWADNYSAIIDGKIYSGKPGEYLIIDRIWDKTTKISISFEPRLQILDGGKSYPDYSAIKYGPRVFAFDNELNPSIKESDKITIDKLNFKPIITNELPKLWIGDCIMKVNALYDGQPTEIKMVPFAEAGQTGGEIRVWIKNNNK